MRHQTSYYGLLVICLGAVVSGACTYGSAVAQGSPDSELEDRVEAALVGASDLPANAITVEASDGVVTLTGSVVCEECGGTRTPAGVGTIQQSLGAVVRAVPGVERVEFNLQYRPPAGSGGG